MGRKVIERNIKYFVKNLPVGSCGIFLSKLNGHPLEAPLAQRMETSVGQTNCQHCFTYKLSLENLPELAVTAANVNSVEGVQHLG